MKSRRRRFQRMRRHARAIVRELQWLARFSRKNDNLMKSAWRDIVRGKRVLFLYNRQHCKLFTAEPCPNLARVLHPHVRALVGRALSLEEP